ncbi:MAG: hypothetical protein AB1714_04860 [Acidobacteriota bacterium]
MKTIMTILVSFYWLLISVPVGAQPVSQANDQIQIEARPELGDKYFPLILQVVLSGATGGSAWRSTLSTTEPKEGEFIRLNGGTPLWLGFPDPSFHKNSVLISITTRGKYEA